MKKIIFLFVITLLVFLPNNSKAEDMVTVRLKKDIGETSSLNFRLRGDYFTPHLGLILHEGENYKLVIKNGILILKSKQSTQILGSELILAPRQYDGDHLIFINGTPYLGAMVFVIEEGQSIRPINQLPLEDYLKGVVPFEVYPSWNIEALKAQALAARTYAVSHRHRTLVDTIQDQVYGGYLWDKKTTEAVEATKGEVITYHNRLIDAFYSASNGGMTENNAHVWGGKSKPFYPIKKDPFDPVDPWYFTFHQTQIDLNGEKPKRWPELIETDKDFSTTIKSWLLNKSYIGEIKILAIPQFEISEKRNPADRSLRGSMTIEFLQKFYGGLIRYEKVVLDDVPLNHIRPIIGGNRFKSYLVDSFYCDGNTCTVKGRGYGHGVGMSQWGASIMGDRGKNYQEIIQFYFPGTKITNISELDNKKAK